ncbi:MAG: adenylyltransferase/cytidyltransferase family protein [Candidatus Nanohaloarchaea archaeon]
MKTVMAQGTFDILHPGHIHYLGKSAELGDELVVVISRDSRMASKKDLYFSEDDRREMVDSLEMVDRAVLGSEGDIYSTVEKIDPDIITLGYDQSHDEDGVRKMAEKATGHDVKVIRVSEKQGYSSSDVRASFG